MSKIFAKNKFTQTRETKIKDHKSDYYHSVIISLNL